MSTTELLRQIQEELAFAVSLMEHNGTPDFHVDMQYPRRWLAVLDAHLAAPRCPECGTMEQPFVSYNVRADGPYSWTMCGSMHCDRQTEGANDAEAVAKFYEGEEVKP